MAFARRLGGLLGARSGTSISAAVSASVPSLYYAARLISYQVYVGGIQWDVNDEQLREHFQPFGEITDARIIIDHENGRSKGFGFVSFATEEEAQNAVKAMDGKEIAGRAVRVNYSQERPSFGGGGGRGYGNNAGGYGNSGNRYPSRGY